MFDYLRSSYDLGLQFTNTECHTKDIEYGIGGTMTFYWLDPAGQLWRPDYIGTHTFEEISENDERYNEKLKFLNFEWIPNGKNGRYIPHKITKYIEVYPATWEGEWKDWPRCRLHFVDGVLKDFKEVTREQSL